MTRARDVANLIGSGNYSSTTFTATAGQTVFSIAHTQNFVQVFMNGLLLDLTVDYTSNGSAVTLTSGAAAGDEIEVVAYNTFSVGDALNQAAADTRYVNTTGDTMSGNLAITKSDASITPDADADDFVIEGNQAIGMTIGSSASSVGSIRFADSGSPRAGMLYYSHITDEMRLYTNATQHLTVNSSGHVTTPKQPYAILKFTSGDDGAYNQSTAANKIIKPSNVLSNNGNHYSTSTGLFTCPVAGVYTVQCSGNVYNLNAGTWLRPTVYKNSGVYLYHYENTQMTWHNYHFTTPVVCAANDTLGVWMGTQTGNGGGFDVNNYSMLSFMLVA